MFIFKFLYQLALKKLRSVTKKVFDPILLHFKSNFLRSQIILVIKLLNRDISFKFQFNIKFSINEFDYPVKKFI